MTVIPNTGTKAAYGVHGPNSCQTVVEMINEITMSGTDETYNEAIDQIKEGVKRWLDDPSEIGEFFDDEVQPGSDPETDKEFRAWVASCLKAADVIYDANDRDTIAGIVEEVADLFDTETGWPWEEVNDLVIQHLNDQGNFCDGEPHTYTHTMMVKVPGEPEEAPIKLMASPLGGALHLWVMESPYMVPCQGCSPCLPGAGDLDSPTRFIHPDTVRHGAWDPVGGKYAYCLPPEWFDDQGEKCSYPEVYDGDGIHLYYEDRCLLQVWPARNRVFIDKSMKEPV